jgi:pimeloyl-ACP methyl ester carboxylesterase
MGHPRTPSGGHLYSGDVSPSCVAPRRLHRSCVGAIERREVAIATEGATLPGELGESVRSCSRTVAEAAAGARATSRSRTCSSTPASPRCSSTCSPRARRSSGPTSSTSRCSLPGSAWRHGGYARSQRREVCPSATSARARARRRRCGPRRAPSSRSEPVVSRGGRPDLAAPRLPLVKAPTLLIVGGADEVVLELNRAALADLRSCEHELSVVAAATHLFEEPGALEQVAELAARWFARHL